MPFALLPIIENRLHRSVVEQIESEKNGDKALPSYEHVRALARALL